MSTPKFRINQIVGVMDYYTRTKAQTALAQLHGVVRWSGLPESSAALERWAADLEALSRDEARAYIERQHSEVIRTA